jgi:predicted NBD/HSP70 family sugar kinase
MRHVGRVTVRDLRRGNEASVLRALYLDGPFSRQRLSQLTGLSAATVSNVVGELMADGLVMEAGHLDSDGGRRQVLLRVNPTYGFAIGVDVGETRIRVELFDLTMAKVAAVDYAMPPGRGTVEQVARHIIDGIEEVLATSRVPRDGVLGVGIGVPGIVAGGSDPRIYTQTLGWDGVPLGALIRAGTALPLLIDNGAKTMGRAELWFGAARGVQQAAVVLIGSGVGASVITNGETYRGVSSSAGEWGHTTVVVDGRRCRCGLRGCLEAYVGAEAIVDRFRAACPDAIADGAGPEEALAAILAAASTTPPARRVLELTMEYLGAGLASLINLLNPERIIIGGWVGLLLGHRLLPEIRAAAARHALAQPYAQVSIELGALGPDAVALGAATLVIEQFLGGGTGANHPPRAARRPRRAGPPQLFVSGTD